MSRVETADSALQNANALFVDENFEEALKNYNLSLQLDSNNVEALIKRSTCYHKLNKFTESLADAQTAINLEPNNPRAYLRKGIALFSLEEYESAKTAFEKGKQLEPDNASFRTWERKCDAELELEKKSSASKPVQTPTQTQATPTTTTAPTNPSTSTPTPASKIKYEWYQTATDVYVSVFIKNLKKEDTTIDITAKTLSVTAKLPDSNSEYQLEIDLCDEVIPQQSSTSYMPAKIEIKLKKAKQARWKSLEGSGNASGTASWDSVSKPTSSTTTHKPKKNWDKIISEEMADEKPEGEEALNKVFQDIYSNGSEDQKRAMMKSFLESGGTVLSTNWDEVGKAPVKGSPPEGMEMHKWNEL